MDTQDDLFVTIQPVEKAHLQAEVPDVIPPTLAERFLAAVEKQYGPLPPAGPVNGRTIRQGCRFCGGKGCLVCGLEAERVYKEQFPVGPQPVMTFRRDDPADMDRLKQLFETL